MKALDIKIKIKDIDGTWGYSQKIQKLLRATLSKEIIFHPDRYIIAFHSLRLFNFRKGTYHIDNKESVEKACLKILEKFGIFKSGKLGDVFKDLQKGKTDYTPIYQFVKRIVGFNKLPGDILYSLEDTVKENLKELLQLIEQYEKDPIVINYNKGEKRNEHKTKTIVDFYLRCLHERDVIVKYLINDLENRAITKAYEDDVLSAGFTWLWYEAYWDKPYKWWQQRSIEFFDYKKINVCMHRLSEITLQEIPKLEVLYHVNKVAFYRRLKKNLPPLMIFHQIRSYYIPMLSKLAERQLPFDELEKLFKSKRWIGFTALALSQVEGVFSDMLDAIYPHKQYSSLSTKVSAVRPLYKHAERNFDYFEYHLPTLRNSFLHSGSAGGRNFKLISLDLLYDLHYLMSVFLELNDPLIELNNILKRRHEDNITGIESLNHIFYLVDAVEKRYKLHPQHIQSKEALDAWKTFEIELSQSYDVDYYVGNVSGDIDQRVDSFLQSIQIDLKDNGTLSDLHTLDLKTLRKNRDQVIEIIDKIGFNLSEDFNYLYNISKFTKNCNKFLPNCSKAVFDTLADIHKRHNDNFNKIEIIEPAFSEWEKM